MAMANPCSLATTIACCTSPFSNSTPCGPEATGATRRARKRRLLEIKRSSVTLRMPPPSARPNVKLPKTFQTPHCAYHSQRAQQPMNTPFASSKAPCVAGCRQVAGVRITRSTLKVVVPSPSQSVKAAKLGSAPSSSATQLSMRLPGSCSKRLPRPATSAKSLPVLSGDWPGVSREASATRATSAAPTWRMRAPGRGLRHVAEPAPPCMSRGVKSRARSLPIEYPRLR
mmetsp:Transcript_50108/g.116340  ORF Transcript_50108/g.116340 Transcript_50108/m.116340 type:complete len:228 (-) Transcript_50108:192-875(-)